MNRKTLTRCLKTIWGAHHFVENSQDVADIAAVINVSPERVVKLMQSPYWDQSLHFWGYTPPLGDLKLAQELWEELVIKGEHINPVEYPDKTIKAPPGDPDVFALIQSHLFCVDNLSDTDIRDRLSEDGDPVRYEGQKIRGYHWFAYPNEAEGLYSKVLARVNVAGDLVVDFGDETCLVCIRHGRLTLTRQIADDVANVADERVRICT